MANHETTILSEFDPSKVGHLLGPEGTGFAIIENFIPVNTLDALHSELNEPDMPWLPGKTTNKNEQGEPIKQVFDVFAHKLSQGSQDRLKQMPNFRALAHVALEDIVRQLSNRYPHLNAWKADEIVAQRYPEDGGGLGWHRDNARHPGVIITYSVEGERLLSVRHNGIKTEHELFPGFVTIMRATNLYNSHFLRKVIGLQHSVTAPKGSNGSTSVTIRANSRPGEPIPNMTYYNWAPETGTPNTDYIII